MNRKSLKQLLPELTQRFKVMGSDDPHTDACLILSKATGYGRVELYSKDDYIPDENEMRKISYFALKREEGCPIQYILGVAEFMGLKFFVNESTLIPRADTETLVEEIISISRSKGYKKGLDIGTGSGAIAVSLAYYNKTLDMTASDISIRAIDTAKWNAYENKVSLNLVLSDIFENITGTFDFIVSNPPYIKRSVIPTLDKNVRNYEPIKALDGGSDGLCFYRKIIKKSRLYLRDGGLLAFEIGYDQGEEVSGLMNECGYTNIQILKDLAGLDRVVLGYQRF